jgi:prepilin signal peptidase PulO-like enzyme (type II secretory pathway)
MAGHSVIVLSGSLCAVAFAAFLGLLRSDFGSRSPLPFGPFLCIGTLSACFLMLSGAG